jgi:hypothetical protein
VSTGQVELLGKALVVLGAVLCAGSAVGCGLAFGLRWLP